PCRQGRPRHADTGRLPDPALGRTRRFCTDRAVPWAMMAGMDRTDTIERRVAPGLGWPAPVPGRTPAALGWPEPVVAAAGTKGVSRETGAALEVSEASTAPRAVV